MVYDPRQDPKYAHDKLLLALTHQESRFNPNAVSPTGARGLTQVLPSTARSPGFGIPANPAALSDPEQNMAFGKAYLSAMLKRYGNDKAAALVAYNGGPGKADEWVASGKNDKVLSKETSNYYKSVLGKAGEGYDFSKIKATLPKSTSSTDDEEETTGFSKLKVPGSKPVVAKPSEDESDAEEADDEEKSTTPKVAKVKASKKEDDEDDDEEDDDEGSGGGKSKGGRSIAGGALELKQFTPGPMFKPVAVQLGVPKLQIAALETLDDPRDR